MYLFVYQYTGILVLFIVIHEFVEAISFETKFDSQFLRLLDLKMFKMIFFSNTHEQISTFKPN